MAKRNKIEVVTRYIFKGGEFKTLEEIKDKIHNIIGEEFFDKMMRVCPPERHKDIFNLLDVLCSKEVREALIDCFTVEVENPNYEIFDNEEEFINILDYKN